MEDDDHHHHGKEELKHLCKYCGKRFRSGRSLGGHVRSHREWIWESSPEVNDGITGIYKKKLRPLSDYRSAMDEEEDVEEEDVEAFLASLDPNHEILPRSRVLELLSKEAIGCLTALLERKIPHNRLDLFAYADRSRPLIFEAAERGFYGAVVLFLRHGVSPSARLPTRYDRPEMIPIDSAIFASCSEQWDLKFRNKIVYHQRLYSLMLWLPEWISSNLDWWHTVKLLGQTTEQGMLEMRILQYARNGQAARLLWLLLAVPDRVLSPTFFRDTTLQQRFGTASLSLRNFLIAQLAFFTGIRFTLEPHGRSHWKGIRHDLGYSKSSLTCSLRLLEVFRRAGPQLCHLMAMLEKEKEMKTEREKERETYPLLPNYPIAQQFKTVLKEAGFPMASLQCPDRTTHQGWKPEPDYHWTPQRDDYPELEFLIRPPHLRRSEILDSDFNRAIEKLCQHPCLKEWTSQMSIFKLLFIFCLPEVVEKMQSVLPPKYVNPATVIQPVYLAELCFTYIAEGRIVEFTAALMATQVLLRLGYPLRPHTSRNSNNNVDHHHRMIVPTTVYESLLHALMRVLDEEISLTGKPKDDDSVQICKEKKLVISSAFLLTKIFEKSAQDFHWYLHSPRYKELRDLKLIVNDVASLLKGTGFALRSRDICVNELNCFSSKSGSSKTELEGSSSSSFEPLLQTAKLTKFSTRTFESSLHAQSISKLPARSYHSFPTSRYPGNRVNSVAKKVEARKQLDAMRRNNWRFLTVIRRVIMWF
ncbi:unnamed protein product [Linum trigynum]|uniref:C2H2-type domain-containing protein n=1 Tax=Linum trigynum TaxID=586398 RepID=A0AAV2F0F3_9ROSI